MQMRPECSTSIGEILYNIIWQFVLCPYNWIVEVGSDDDINFFGDVLFIQFRDNNV